MFKISETFTILLWNINNLKSVKKSKRKFLIIKKTPKKQKKKKQKKKKKKKIQFTVEMS